MSEQVINAEETAETVKAPKAKKEKAPKEPKAPRDSANGVTRPAEGTKTGKVWEIADKLSNELGQAAPRKDVIVKASAEGINLATITTQYGHWRRYNGLSAVKTVAAVAAVAAVAPAVGDVVVEGEPTIVPATAPKGKKKG